ncbi:MAG TPA: hypothetical protein DF613_10530 [Lachnospiraceae bacterium]|nr:hypothetical protein [Lachnospiraceae bacterium]
MSLYTKIIDRQKLSMAWDRVKKNRPACGVDNVTWEMYDNEKKENIRRLHVELAEHTYEPLPVKSVTIYKGEKAREIALYTMRDKNVQQAIAVELTRIYDHMFSACAYAYRPNKSALSALEVVENVIKKGGVKWSLKADIAHFFDTIDTRMLEKKLAENISEKDVVSLILKDCTAPRLTEDGELTERRRGVYQGSAIAPVLSNIYMMDFDREMERLCPFYLRYSDDILVLTENKEEAEAILQRLKTWMESLGLALNEKKTCISEIAEGFRFLGYAYDCDGKSIPPKARDDLAERLETMWYTSKGLSVKERLRKGAEILEGWSQYFQGERSPGSIEEYAVVLYMTGNKAVEIPPAFLAGRKELHNTDREICRWLAETWKKHEDPAMELAEYEDYFLGSEADAGVVIEKSCRDDLLEQYRALLVEEQEDLYRDIMQLYTEAGCYNKASLVAEQIKRFQLAAEERKRPVIQFPDDTEDRNSRLRLTKEQWESYYRNFVGREDLYVEELPGRNNRRECRQVPAPLDDEVLKEHISGQRTVGTYVQRCNATAKYMVIDIDVSKRAILEAGDAPDVMRSYLQKAADLAAEFEHILRTLGLTGYIEESGFRGYHIWVLFTEWIPLRYIHMLEEIIENKVGGMDAALSVEYFPNKTRVNSKKPGQAMKLPFGFHIRSGRQSWFLNESFERVDDVGAYISQMVKHSLPVIRKIIGASAAVLDKPPHLPVAEKKVDEDLEAFQEASDNVLLVLKKCNLMRYLCQKAKNTGYLTHFERLSLLYVFGHMGEEGESFLHSVMGFTLNYQYHVTQKFISKKPEKPISCIKLRDQYQKITAEYGCSCNFKRIKNCYPSPVLHAIKSGQDDSQITLPVSRTVSKEKEAKLCEELNLNKTVQSLVVKILEFKKQKRGIEKNVTKLEKELEQLFDEAQINCLEVEYGLLVRRKKEQGYEWVVEI